MLVDNDVVGDSRVQKEARSAAEAGWDVTLVGLKSRGTTELSWRIGEAEVRLFQLPSPMRNHRLRTSRSLRRPLAYRQGHISGYRMQKVRARRSELVNRFGRAALAQREGEPSWRVAIRRVALLPSRVVLLADRKWVNLRRNEMIKLKADRADGNKLFTRLGIRFWQATRGKRAWRQLDPALWDFELALGKVVDEIDPDIVHANDFRMIGVAARAKMRAARRGRTMRVVWDAHEYVPGLNQRAGDPRWLPAQIAHEQEFSVFADAVVTVSPGLAELLKRDHGLAELPTVVLNCPDVPEKPDAAEEAGADERLRLDCGIDADTPLVVYGGEIGSVRGVDLLVEAMPYMKDLHLALVCLHPNGNRTPAEPIEQLAVDLGVSERVHLLKYVPHDEVVSYLSGADAAVVPLRHLPNHEIALSAKFFEYSQARLPLVVSDVKAMAEIVRSTGQGEVYQADDAQDYVRAVEAVLADPARYRAAYENGKPFDEWNWRTQADHLERVYSAMAPVVPSPQNRTAGSERA